MIQHCGVSFLTSTPITKKIKNLKKGTCQSKEESRFSYYHVLKKKLNLF